MKTISWHIVSLNSDRLENLRRAVVTQRKVPTPKRQPLAEINPDVTPASTQLTNKIPKRSASPTAESYHEPPTVPTAGSATATSPTSNSASAEDALGPTSAAPERLAEMTPKQIEDWI